MKTYLVGGAVRDELLQLPVTERDWVVVGAIPQDMVRLGYQQVGKGFPVFLHPESREEYALARTERKSTHGYTGFLCCFSPDVTLEADLHRRDLTINAIARDEHGLLIDPYQGQQDIQQRWLRHVSEAFVEDPLRVLRVARFAARFAHLNFRIAPNTLALMQKMITELPYLPPERVWKETERALGTLNPQIYFQVLHDCGALKALFPEIDALFDISSLAKKRHKNIDSGTDILMRVSIAARLSEDIAIRFAILCHAITKLLIPCKLGPNHNDYGTDAVKLVDTLCQRLKVPSLLRNLAKIVVQHHNLLQASEQLTSKKVMQLFNVLDVWRRPERLEQMIIIIESDAYWRTGFKNNASYKGDFLRKAYRIAHSVSTKELIAAGFKGEQIGEELSIRRQHALKTLEATGKQ